MIKVNSSWYKWSIFVCLASCVLLTTHGFYGQKNFSLVPWDNQEAFKFFLMVFGVLFGSFTVWSKVSRSTPLAAGFYAIVFISLLTGNFWPLLVVGLFASASYTVGGYFLKLLGIGTDSQKGLYKFLAGAGLYGIGIGLLAHWPINYPGLYGVMLIAPLLLSKGSAISHFVILFKPSQKTNPSLKTFKPLDALLATLMVVHFLYALLPELGYDALALHLLVPSHLFYRHAWGFNPSLYAMALIPMLGEWIFSIGYMLSGEVGARLINLLFTHTIAYQAYKLTKDLGGNDKASMLAAILLLSTPLTLVEDSTLGVEAIWGCFVVGGVMALLKLEKAASNLILGALLFGIAANAKAITLPILPVVALYLLVYQRKCLLEHGFVKLIGSILLFIVIGSIPYLTAFWISGNPVLPFFNGFFHSVYYPSVNFNNELYNSGVTWDLLYKITFASSQYLEATMGAAGFQWLLLLPASLLVTVHAKDWKTIALVLISLAALYLIFCSQSYLRYIFPLLVFFTAVIAMAFYRFSFLSRGFTLCFSGVLAVAIGLNILFFTSAVWTYRSLPIQILWSDGLKANYLLNRMPVRSAVDLINHLNVEHSPVAFFTQQIFAAGLHADALYPNWYNNAFKAKVNSLHNSADVAKLLKDYQSTYVILDETWRTAEVRAMVEAATDKIAQFGIISVRRLKDEFRFNEGLLKNKD